MIFFDDFLRNYKSNMSECDKDISDVFVNIMDERKFVDVKPFSHNIISLELRIISDKYGKETANKLIKMCKLEELGWMITTDDADD